MPPQKSYTPEQMADAIRESNGILAVAARRVGCSRTTIHTYVNKYASVRKAYEDANETTLDFVEGKLMELVRAGNVAATIFFLKTKGKSRGYVERQEVTGADSAPVKIVVEYKK